MGGLVWRSGDQASNQQSSSKEFRQLILFFGHHFPMVERKGACQSPR